MCARKRIGDFPLFAGSTDVRRDPALPRRPSSLSVDFDVMRRPGKLRTSSRRRDTSAWDCSASQGRMCGR